MRKEDRPMPILRYIMLLISAVGISAMGLVMLLGQESFGNLVQAFPTLMNSPAVEDGTKITVRFQITPQDNPSMSYSNTEQFIQGQHTVQPGLEEQTAGMHPERSKRFRYQRKRVSAPT